MLQSAPVEPEQRPGAPVAEEDGKNLLSRRDIVKGSAALVAAAPAACQRVLAQAPGARDRHPRARRGGEEGRPARLLHGHGHPGRRAVRQPSRPPTPASPCGSSAGLGAGLPAHRPGARQQHLRGRCRQQRRRRALHRLEAQRLAGGLSARGGGPAFPIRAPRSRRHARHDAHLALLTWLQHPPGERPKRRPGASPTCSIPNGWAT